MATVYVIANKKGGIDDNRYNISRDFESKRKNFIN